MTTLVCTTLSEILGPGSGLVAADRINSIRLRRQLVLDIARAAENDVLHDTARSFFASVPWVEQVPSVDSLSAALDHLDGIPPHALGAAHILVGGDGDQLRYRLFPGESVRIYEMPVASVSGASRILPAQIMPVYRRPAPSCLNRDTPIIVHGCKNGDHDGLITSLWYALGCEAPLLMPTCPLRYEVLATDIRMCAAEPSSAPRAFRRIERETVATGDW